MPDPGWVGIGAAVATSTKDSAITPAFPAGAAAGQLGLLFANVSNYGTGAVAPTVPTPSGWTLLGTVHASGFTNNRNPRTYVFGRQLTDLTAPSVTMTGGVVGTAGSDHVQAALATVTNAALADVLVGATATGDTTAISVPSPGTLRAGSLVVAVTGTGNSNTVTAQALSGGATVTERADYTVGSRLGMMVATAPQAAAGAPGTFSGTYSAASPWGGMLLGIQPAAPAGDTTPPTVTVRTPAAGSTGVSRSTTVTATFSEAMDGSTSGAFTLTPSGGSPVTATVSTTSTVWTLTPSAALAYGTTYTATVGTGARDLAGNALAAPDSWTFTTEAEPAPPPAAVGSGSGTDPDRWALEVVDRNGVVVSSLAPTSFKITVRMNAAGDLSGSLLADAPGAPSLEVYSRVIRAWRRQAGAAPGTARTLRFAGHIHQLTDSGDEHGLEVVTFVARDPSVAALARFMPWNSSYATAGSPGPLSGAVAQLIGDASISAEDPSGLDATYPHGLSVTAMGGGWPNGTWAWERHQPIQEAFRAIQEGEAGTAGFYWTVTPVVGGGSTLATMRIAVAPADLTPLAGPFPSLEYGPGTRANLRAYTIERIPPVNSVIAVGEGALAWKNDSESSGATYGLWPTMVRFSEDTTARLDALARGVWHVWPTDTIQVEVAWPADPDGPRPPTFWDDMDLGDSVPVLIRGARRTVSGTAIIREATIEVDAEGTERLTSLVLELAGTS